MWKAKPPAQRANIPAVIRLKLSSFWHVNNRGLRDEVINPTISASDTIRVYIIKAMYRQPPFFKTVSCIFIVSKKSWNFLTFLKVATVVKHLDCQVTVYYNILPAWAGNDILRIIHIQCSSTPSWPNIRDTSRYSISCLRSALAILTSCSRSTFSPPVLTVSHTAYRLCDTVDDNDMIWPTDLTSDQRAWSS